MKWKNIIAILLIASSVIRCDHAQNRPQITLPSRIRKKSIDIFSSYKTYMAIAAVITVFGFSGWLWQYYKPSSNSKPKKKDDIGKICRLSGKLTQKKKKQRASQRQQLHNNNKDQSKLSDPACK